MAYDGLWRRLDLQKPPRGGLRQGLDQGMQRRKRAVKGGSQLVAQLADAFLQGHVPPPQAVGGREGWITGTRQQELALAQEVEDTGGIFFLGFPGAVLHRFAMVPHGLAVHQADLRATAVEPFLEGLPGDPGRFHGDQGTLTSHF